MNYQELLALNNNPDASVDQKIVGNRLRNNRLTNRFNLETSYLEYRVKSIQMASIASNPIHPGIHGSYVTPMNIVEFENQKRYEELPTSGAFIRFLSSNRGITLDSFFNSYTTCVENLFNAYINKFDKTKFDLNPTEWKELTAFFQENFLDKEHLSPIEKKNLLNDPYISKFVHRNSAKELTAIFSKYDPYKLENHILSFLLSQKSEPQGLDLVISDADKNNREIFLGEIKTNPNPCSLLERAIENDTLQRVVGEITSRFYTQFSPVSAS